MSNSPIIIDGAFLTDLETETILTMNGDISISDQKIVNIFSKDSSDKLMSKQITTWFQMIGAAMSLRVLDPDTNLIIDDKKWINRICAYLDTCDISNPEIIAFAVVTYLDSRIFVSSEV